MLGLGALKFLWQAPPSGGVLPVPPPWPRKIETMLWLNDMPLERIGLVLQQPSAWLDDVTRPTPQTTRILGLTGGRYQELLPSSPLEITLEGALVDVSIDVLQEQLALLRDFLTGLIEMRWPHAPQYVRRARAGELRVRPFRPEKAFLHPDRQAWLVSVPLTCADGVTYARQPRRIRLSTTPRPVRTGGIAVGGIMLLEGPLSGEVRIILESPTGVRLHQTVLVIPGPEALDTGDVCEIRCNAPHAIIRRPASGPATSAYHWRSIPLSDAWWQVSPADADRWRDQYPRVRTSTGSGWWTYHLAEAA